MSFSLRATCLFSSSVHTLICLWRYCVNVALSPLDTAYQVTVVVVSCLYNCWDMDYLDLQLHKTFFLQLCSPCITSWHEDLRMMNKLFLSWVYTYYCFCCVYDIQLSHLMEPFHIIINQYYHYQWTHWYWVSHSGKYELTINR